MCIQYHTYLFGENLQKKMRELGITEEVLKEKTGIEDLDHVPEIEVLAKVCQTLNCDVKSLMN